MKAATYFNWDGEAWQLVSDARDYRILLGLLLALLVTAISVVYIKDYNRRLFVQYQQISQQHRIEQVSWSRLLLEQSTWATQSRIQTFAQNRLNMVLPRGQQVIMVALNDRPGVTEPISSRHHVVLAEAQEPIVSAEKVTE